MEQTAIVKRILPTGIAEVSLLRQTECGLHCKSCNDCRMKPQDELLALADNSLGAQVGAVVTVRPNDRTGAWAAGLMFLLPCIGLIVGYLIAQGFGLSQGLCIAVAFFGLVVGFLPALFANRIASKTDKPEFTIVSLRR